MAKVKRTKKVKRINKTSIRTVQNNRLSILLIILALLVFALVAYSLTMTKSGGNQMVNSNQVKQMKVTPSPTAKPTAKTVKTSK